MQHTLATSSSTDYTVAWDIRHKHKIAALAYGYRAGTMDGMQAFSGAVMVIDGRKATWRGILTTYVVGVAAVCCTDRPGGYRLRGL